MNSVNELDQEVLELNSKNAIKGEPDGSLEQLLTAYTLDKLKIVAVEQELVNRSKLKKGEMVERLSEAILNEARLSLEMTIMEENEYQFLLEAAHGNNFAGQIIYPEVYGHACRLGYIYLVLKDDVLHYVMPQEVRALFLDIQTSEFLKKAADYRVKWDYIKGLSNFYGMVTFEHIVKLYNEYNDDYIAIEDMRRVFDLFSNRPQINQLYENYVVNDYVLEDDVFEWLKEATEGMPIYLPSEEEILLYADDLYYEQTPQLQALEDYLLREFPDAEPEGISDLVSDIQLLVSMEEDFQMLIDLFESYKLKFSSLEQVNEISLLITDVINHTRLWSNRGYTPMELHALNGTPLQEPPEVEAPKQVPVRVEKIGRNEPCPCGSGKKYKKCCGE